MTPQFEIFNPVVVLHAILMVDCLIRKQRPSQVLLHDDAVLQGLPAVVHDLAIAPTVYMASPLRGYFQFQWITGTKPPLVVK